MKKILKVLKWALIIMVTLITGFFLVLLFFFPRVSPAPDMKVATDSASVARGEYLANHVSGCVFCHGTIDKTIFGQLLDPSSRGKGGNKWAKETGIPGNLFAPNITPFALKDWTDGEIFRAITAGVSRDGHALFPIMPYPEFRNMAEDDVKCIIAYLRTLPSIENKPEATSISFPVNLFIRMAPGDPEKGIKTPSKSDPVAYGKYMTTIAACPACHTPQGMMGPDESKYLAGGFEFYEPGYGYARSANLTPDEETGMGKWSEEAFMAKFTQYRDPENHKKIKKGEPWSPMPWIFYSSMNDDDLHAIYHYLKTIKPVVNKVEKFTAEK